MGEIQLRVLPYIATVKGEKMKKTIVQTLFLAIIVLIAHAQAVPEVRVSLSEPAAAIDQTIMANVYVDSDLEMVGADVTVEVDSECLEISGEYVQGPYFTPGDGNSVVLFQDITTTSARIAANMLNFDLNPTAGDLFFSIPVTIKCESGSPAISVVDAHLVQRGIIEYKLSEDSVVASATILEISDAVQEIAEPTATAIPPTAVPEDTLEIIEEPTADTSSNGLIMAAIAVIVAAALGIIGLIIMSLRSRRR